MASAALDLIGAARHGDVTALGALYDVHAARLLRIAFRVLGTADDAEDVVHDVFVGLPEALRHYDERGRFDAWLAQITVRTALMRRRRDQRRRTDVQLDAIGASAPEPSADVRIEMLDVHRALAELPETLRDVYLLHQVEGFSHLEIGELLHISPGASRVRLTRALDALRRLLRAHSDDSSTGS